MTENAEIKVLLIDDDKTLCVTLSGEAREHNIKIVDAQNLEIGLEKLKEDSTIQFVILDGKCMLDDDQQTAKENFVHEAIEKIKLLEHTDDRVIPFCVNTGFMKDLSASLEGRTRVFDKPYDNSPMFKLIIEEVSRLPITTIKRNYKEAFEIFDSGWLEMEHQDKLIKILIALDGNNQVNDDFNVIRKLYEECLKTLERKFKYFPDPEFFNERDGGPNLALCTYYLSGRKAISSKGKREYNSPFETPQHMSWVLGHVKELSSILSHSYNSKTSRFVFKSVVYSLLEILIWLPVYTLKNYPTEKP